MKIYFTAATSFNGDLHKLYRKIADTIKQKGSLLVSGEQVIDKKLLQKDKKLRAQEIFDREKKRIADADAVIAEVSKPSLGVGTDIGFALDAGKHVLALVHKDYEDRISPMIKGNPSDKLFLEYYNDDNLGFKIKDFLLYVKKQQEKNGRLIVIDGGDGSGKTTQAELLVKYLKHKNVPVKYMDFPQYYHSFHGKTVARFLRGEFGKIDEVNPYLISLAYALDRASVRREMEEFLRQGGTIVANRYATSNMAHQAAKLGTHTEKEEYLKWVYELEYKVHKIPKEDLVIYLYVPWQIGLQLTASRGTRKSISNDITERDIKHRQEAEKMYLELTKRGKHWIKIDCVENGKMQSKEAIHQKIIFSIDLNPKS